MKHRLLTFAAAAFCLAAVPAMAQQGIEDPQHAPYQEIFKNKRVVFLPLAMGFDLTEAWGAAMKKQADELGYKFDIRDPNWNTDAGAQALTQIISEKPDVIVAHNPDVQVYARLLQRAQKAGIYVIQVNMASAFTTEAYVGADWIGLGELQAKVVANKCSPKNGGSGKIAITQGPLTAAASAYQMRGVANVLDKNPDIKVVSNQVADWDASKARSVTATAIQQNPDLCGVIGFWDGMDIGASAAISEAGKQGKIFLVTSGGGARSACENIQKGTFDADVSYDAAGQGRDLNDMIKVVLQSKAAPGQMHATLFSPMHVITKENVKASACYDISDLK